MSKVTKDMSDNIKAAAVLASFPLNKLDRIIEYASASIVTIKGTNLIPLRIGDHWFFLSSDTAVSTATDLDTGTVAAGKDYYVYACDNSGTLVFKISLASTYPSGFDATNSRKLGGFHTLCAAVGTISGHPLSGASASDILPQSVWDLKHRPLSEPEGMVWSSKAGIWVDIYLVSGTGASTASKNGETISDSKNWVDFVDDFAAVKKQLLCDSEFQIIAAGSNEETNISGSADPVSTGGHSDGSTAWAASTAYALQDQRIPTTSNGYIYRCTTAGTSDSAEPAWPTTIGNTVADGTAVWTCQFAIRRMVSDIGCEDCCGVMWQWLLDQSWRADGLPDTGDPTWAWQDLNGDKGSLYKQGTYGDVKLLAGAYWDGAGDSGSRSRDAYHYRWSTGTSIGGRGRSRAQ